MENLLKVSHKNQNAELSQLDESVMAKIEGGHDGVSLTSEIRNGVPTEPVLDEFN